MIDETVNSAVKIYLPTLLIGVAGLLVVGGATGYIVGKKTKKRKK